MENASCVKGAFSYMCVFYADKSNCQNYKRQTSGVAKLLHFSLLAYRSMESTSEVGPIRGYRPTLIA